MKCVLQINGFSGPRPQVRSSRRVGSGGETKVARLNDHRSKSLNFLPFLLVIGLNQQI